MAIELTHDEIKLAANVENLTLTGTVNTTGRGNVLGNIIEGNSGANSIFGGAGNDTLTGGSGADFFFFDTTLDQLKNVDIITDFKIVEDKLMLDNKIAFVGLQVGPLAAQQFHIGSAAHDLDDRIVYNPATGALIFDSNGSVAGGGLLFAILPTALQLTSGSFQVYATT